MIFDHTSLNMTFPILALIFFDPLSHMFSDNITNAERSMLYGLCISIPHILNLIFTPILSFISDEYGRKKVLILGTAGAALFSLVAGLGVLYGLFILLFLGLLIRGAFSRTNPIAQAVIGDLSEKHEKVQNMGYLQGAISIGAFIGPMLGGYFAHRFLFNTLNFSLPFFIAGIFAAISVFLTILMFKETHTKHTEKNSLKIFSIKSFRKIFAYNGIWQISVILLLTQIGWSIYYQYIPPLLKLESNFSANHLGIFVGLIAVWLALATIFGIKFLQRFFTLEQMLTRSIYLVLIGLVLTVIGFLTHITSLLWIAAIPTAVGDVISYSCLIAFYSNAVERSEQGKVMGICFIIVALIWALTGLFGGLLMSAYALLPMIVAPLAVFILILLMRTPGFTRYF